MGIDEIANEKGIKKSTDKLIVFEDKQIRRVFHEGEWYFSIIDIITVLTESDRPRKYWDDLKRKLRDEGSEVSDKIGQLKIIAQDGKMRETDIANVQVIFRLIQSIPSPKAEPFKLWLAKIEKETDTAQEYALEASYNTTYAIYVHEILTNHHDHGQAKFLEVPFQLQQSKLEEELKIAVMGVT